MTGPLMEDLGGSRGSAVSGRKMSGRTERWLLVVLLLLGAAVRLYRFPAVPVGLHRDELSEAYESWCLLHTGADRWGVHLPVYFVGWGSGQNVLQSYLSIPVVAVLGLTAVSARLVPVVCGILALPLMFLTVRRWHGPVAGLAALAALALSPWHVMLSRWGIENSEQPFFLLLGVYTFGKALDHGSRWVIAPSLLPFALAMYTYGVVIPVMPVVLLGLGIVGWSSIRTRWRAWGAALATFFIASSPLWFFLLKNYVTKRNYGFEHWLPISIPLVPVTRLSEARAEVGGATQWAVNWYFLRRGLSGPFTWFEVPGVRSLSSIVLFCAAVGVVWQTFRLVRDRRLREPFLPMLVSFMLLLLLFPMNISRATPIYAEVAAMAGVGFALMYERLSGGKARVALVVVCTLIFAGYTVRFVHAYFGAGYAEVLAQDFAPDFPAALDVAHRLAAADRPMYVTQALLLNYVDVLFYDKVDPLSFQHSGATWQHPDFGRYRFSRATAGTVGKPFVFILSPGEYPMCTKPTGVVAVGRFSVGECR